MAKSKIPKILKKKEKEFNKLTAKLTLDGHKYILLEKIGLTNTFTNLMELTGTTHRYSNFRQKTIIMSGLNSTEFIEAIYSATDIAMGVEPYDIYEIEQRDIMPPDGQRPWWEIGCTRTGELYSEVP